MIKTYPDTVHDFNRHRSVEGDGRCVLDQFKDSPRRDDPRLLWIPTSRS